MESVGIYGESPFIYPIYGLGGIPEGFSRMSAIYGGVFMLNKDIDKVLFENGKVCGVQSGNEICRTKMVIFNPSYAIKTGNSNRVKNLGKIIRAICILDHPIPHTNNVSSVQIILPQKQTGRKSGIKLYIITFHLTYSYFFIHDMVNFPETFK